MSEVPNELANEACPCGSRKPRAKCCGQYLSNQIAAPTAEALMRSRYTAFCTGHLDYLIATHHGEEWTASDRKNLANTLKTTRWLNLLIVNTQKGKVKDKRGIVEFVAAYRPTGSILSVSPAGEVAQMHERSHFIKKAGRWLYTTGDRLPPYQPKPSEACWCGSSRPFKQCHL